MLYVCQGHEYGVGLEIFFKSCSLLPQEQLDKIELHANCDVVVNHLEVLGFDNYLLDEHYLQLGSRRIKFANVPNEQGVPLTTGSLESCLTKITNEDGLFTLPTSKDQLVLKNKQCAGYTDYLRKRFKTKYLTMNFVSNQFNLVLLTDHIALRKVDSYFSSDDVVKLVKTSLKGFRKYFGGVDEILFSGINPHSGENGLISKTDKKIEQAIKVLKNSHSNILGPVSGDILLGSHKSQRNLYVYASHDQGLGPFKFASKFLGVNVTLGLDFLRTSVDHGTAFDIFGKGIANPSGCFYALKRTLEAIDEC